MAPSCNRCGSGLPYDIAVGWVFEAGETLCSWACLKDGADGAVRTVRPATVPIELFEARIEEHRLEIAKHEMQLVKYRLALKEHGIEPPDMQGEELLQMWMDYRAVVTTASDFVMRLGTAKELLVNWGGQSQ